MARRKNISVEIDEVGTVLKSTSTTTKHIEWDFDTAEQMFIREQKLRHLSSRTIEWHQENLHTVKVFLERQGISTAPKLITTKVLKENYILHMLETLSLSPVTINGRIRTLRAFFAYLVDEAVLDRNPAQTLLPLKTRKTIIETFSLDQVRALLGAANRTTFTGLRDYTIMLLLLETGVRVSELSSMRLQDIHWTDSRILVLGKGDKERLVPFQRQVKHVLKRYLASRGDIPGEDHVFVTVDNLPMSTRTVQERIQDYGKAANLQGVRVSPHTFRHTFAKMYIKNGGDAFSLQAILGHTTLEMVRHYVNLFSSDVQEQHRKYSPIEHMTLK